MPKNVIGGSLHQIKEVLAALHLSATPALMQENTAAASGTSGDAAAGPMHLAQRRWLLGHLHEWDTGRKRHIGGCRKIAMDFEPSGACLHGLVTPSGDFKGGVKMDLVTLVYR